MYDLDQPGRTPHPHPHLGRAGRDVVDGDIESPRNAYHDPPPNASQDDPFFGRRDIVPLSVLPVLRWDVDSLPCPDPSQG